MIRGIGIDIIEIERIQRALKKNGRFIERILTAKERELYNDLPSEGRRLEFIAGRFAAKEAFAKAVGTGLGKLSFQDIHILRHPSGAPEVIVSGYEKEKIFISISHSKAYVVAQIVLAH